MEKIAETIANSGLKAGLLTLGDCIDIASIAGCMLSDVVMFEAMQKNKLSFNAVVDRIIDNFSLNFKAIDAGLQPNRGPDKETPAKETEPGMFPVITEDVFINRIVTYTLAALAGQQSSGLQPCAGTGDSCVYAGFMRAALEKYGREIAARAGAVLLKIGTLFRAGKSNAGCNMCGLGAGSAATSAAFVELAGGSPDMVGRAVVLALSPTIGNPCTPHAMVPGLCASHLGSAVFNGKLASHLAEFSGEPVNIPVDVMIALAAAVHPVSAKHIVPEVMRYMSPYFRDNGAVDEYVESQTAARDKDRSETLLQQAVQEVRYLARRANSIISPFGAAVVGSSQAVGSPANAARLAHFLARGKIEQVTIDLCPELFSQRSLNVPVILNSSVYGTAVADGSTAAEILSRVRGDAVVVKVNRVEEPQMQRISVQASERNSMVAASNRGGGRLALIAVEPDLDECLELAGELQIAIVL